MPTRFAAGAALTLTVAACGQPITMTMQDAGRDIGRLEGGNNFITLSPSIAFEGQRRYVGIVGPSQGSDDLSAATISAPAGSGIVIERTVCSMIFCAFVAHIDDVVANTGRAIPEPTVATQYAITVVGSMLNYSASLDVFPLDQADAAGFGSNVIATDAVYSSLTISSGATLHAADSAVRIAVLNDAQVHGTFDFSASATSPGPGGSAGGLAPMGDGQGPTPGLGSLIAGGGAGFAQAGGAGMGAGGVAGGTGGAAAMDMGVGRVQGGSGGGAGGSGAGGSGGGAIAFSILGTADFGGAQFLARGAAGTGAGGGGAGGMVLLGGDATGTFTIDASGGAGGSAAGATGGHGSPGRVRLEGISSGVSIAGGMRRDGVRWDFTMYEPIVRTAMLTLHGFATAGTHVRIQNEISRTISQRADATAGADGTWSASVMLIPGAASFIAYDASDSMNPIPSLSGTSVVVRGDAGARQVFSGALDVVYVP